MATQLHRLHRIGQSPWIDFVTRHLIQAGELHRLIERGIRGLTANPTIFEKAIAGSTDYDASIRKLVATGAGSAQIYEGLIIEDIRTAADVLRPIYDQTSGVDGYASIEVSPKLAYDTQAGRDALRRLAGAPVQMH